MEQKTTWRVICFEDKSLAGLENQINIFLGDEDDGTAATVWHAMNHQSRGDEAHLLNANVLKSFPDQHFSLCLFVS